MKLIDLIEQKVRLEAMIKIDSEWEINEKLKLYREQLGSNVHVEHLQNELDKAHDVICDQLALMRKAIQDQKKLIDQQIEVRHEEYLDKSEKIYLSSENDPPEYIFERYKNGSQLKDPKILELLKSRIGSYITWQKPGLQIHPLNGNITDIIRGCDPLYLVDTTDQMLFYVKTLWNEKYQKRLRYYTIDEKVANPLLQLPNNQIGLIVCVSYFDYKPLKIIVNFLKDFKKLLCDGGVAVFTYNNCSIPEGVDRVDKKFQTYVPKELLLEIIENLGFEIIKAVDASTTVSWVEIKKPGELKTIKGGQTLAEIFSFS